MMIISLSGRRVKRPVKTVSVKQVGSHWVRTPRILRALRPAKAPAPWAGVRYKFTEAGASALLEAEAFAAYQQTLHDQGFHCLPLIAEVRRCYEIAFEPVRPEDLEPEDSEGCAEVGLQGWVNFTGNVNGDLVSVAVTGDSDDPYSSVWRGSAVHLPSEAFELAAQLYLALGPLQGSEQC